MPSSSSHWSSSLPRLLLSSSSSSIAQSSAAAIVACRAAAAELFCSALLSASSLFLVMFEISSEFRRDCKESTQLLVAFLSTLAEFSKPCRLTVLSTTAELRCASNAVDEGRKKAPASSLSESAIFGGRGSARHQFARSGLRSTQAAMFVAQQAMCRCVLPAYTYFLPPFSFSFVVSLFLPCCFCRFPATGRCTFTRKYR